MNFYTNVTRYGNNLLYIGYKGGQRVKQRIPFKPKLYIKTSKSVSEGGYATLDNLLVEPIEFDSMKDATDFVKRYENVDDFTVYGMNNFVSQFIAQKYPEEIKFNREDISVTTIDIECQSDQGFPEPHLAEWPITAITIKNSKEKVYRTWGFGEFNPADNVVPFSFAMITSQSLSCSNLFLFCLTSAIALSKAPLFHAVSSASLSASSCAVSCILSPFTNLYLGIITPYNLINSI